MTDTTNPAATAAPETDPTMTFDEVTARMYRVIRSTRPEHWLDRGRESAPELTDKGLSISRSAFALQEVSGTRHRSHEDLNGSRIYHSEASYRLPGHEPQTFQGSAAVSEIKMSGTPEAKAAAARQQADTRCLKAATRELLALKAVTWQDLAECGIKRNDVPKSKGADKDQGGGTGGGWGGGAASTATPDAGLARDPNETARKHCMRIYDACKSSSDWAPWNGATAAAEIPRGTKFNDYTADQWRIASDWLHAQSTPASPSGMTDPQREQLAKLSGALGLTPQAKGDLLRSCGHTGGNVSEAVADAAIQALRAELESRGVNPDTGEITPVDPPF